MAKRLVLPVATAAAAERPTVDAVRRRLGGRASSESGAGEVVSFRDDHGLDRTGVVLFVRGAELDVWAPGNLVRRVRREETRPADRAIPPDLSEVSRDAREFGALREGQRVRFEHESGAGEGELVEKCRFGALVERADRAVLGVGFRRIRGA